MGPFGDIDNSLTKALLLDADDESPLAKWKELAVGKRPEFELYDLRTDPWQIENVAGHSAYSSVHRQLKSAVMRWMRKTDDPRASELKTRVFDDYEYFGGPAKKK